MDMAVRRGSIIYVAILIVIALAATVLLTVVAGLDPLIVTVIVLVGIVAFGIVIPGLRAGRRQDAITEDARETCRPILKRYRRKRNVTRLMEEYHAWWAGRHDYSTRILFSQDVVSLLVQDGHADEAREVLADGVKVARKHHLGTDYQRFIDECERRLSARGDTA